MQLALASGSPTKKLPVGRAPAGPAGARQGSLRPCRGVPADQLLCSKVARGSTVNRFLPDTSSVVTVPNTHIFIITYPTPSRPPPWSLSWSMLRSSLGPQHNVTSMLPTSVLPFSLAFFPPSLLPSLPLSVPCALPLSVSLPPSLITPPAYSSIAYPPSILRAFI